MTDVDIAGGPELGNAFAAFALLADAAWRAHMKDWIEDDRPRGLLSDCGWQGTTRKDPEFPRTASGPEVGARASQRIGPAYPGESLSYTTNAKEITLT
ncbi:MAG: hypothetical protein JOY64_26405, partial [Alphaproteobacteria bacterium]|nr:hypothetical protein [Alphaproteobacteria bacterium]